MKRKRLFLIVILIIIFLTIIAAITFYIERNMENNKEPIDITLKTENYNRKEIIEPEKIGKKQIHFLNRDYECNYCFSYAKAVPESSYETFDFTEENSYDVYKADDESCDFIYKYGTNEMYSFKKLKSSIEKNNKIGRVKASKLADLIVFLLEGTSTEFEPVINNMETNTSSFGFLYVRVVDGYDTSEKISMYISQYGELLEYTHINSGKYDGITVNKKDYDDSMKAIEQEIDSKIEQYCKNDNNFYYSSEIANCELTFNNGKLALNVGVNFYKSGKGKDSKSKSGIAYNEFSQEVNNSQGYNTKDYSIVYFDEALTCDSDIVISQAEIQEKAVNFLTNEKTNFDSFELTDLYNLELNDMEFYWLKYVFMVGEYYTTDTISLLFSADGELKKAKEENRNQFDYCVLSEQDKMKAKESYENEYLMISSGKGVTKVNLKELKYSKLSKTSSGILLTSYVNVNLEFFPYRVKYLIENDC